MTELIKAHLWDFHATVWEDSYARKQRESDGMFKTLPGMERPNHYMTRSQLHYVDYDPVKVEEDCMGYLAKWLEGKNDARVQHWTISYKGYDLWWFAWFSHGTFSKFENEAEAFKCFRDWLEGKGFRLNYTSHYENNWHNDKLAKELDMSLMAAEDYWRWRRCDCEGCQKNPDQWIIAH